VPILFNTDYFDLQTDFRLPEIITLRLDNETMSKSKGFKFYWNKDATNGLSVQVNFRYDQLTSQFLNPKGNFPVDDIQISKFVSDEGVYTLQPSDLAKFPSGSTVNMTIIRGSFLFQKSNDKNILMYSMSTDRRPTLTLVD
jgi:hypothetical protein